MNHLIGLNNNQVRSGNFSFLSSVTQGPNSSGRDSQPSFWVTSHPLIAQSPSTPMLRSAKSGFSSTQGINGALPRV